MSTILTSVWASFLPYFISLRPHFPYYTDYTVIPEMRVGVPFFDGLMESPEANLWAFPVKYAYFTRIRNFSS